MRSSTKDTPMKKSLGSLLFLLFIALRLQAAPLATYSLSASKSEVYQKEAVEITFKAQQKDHSHVMFFFLHPKKSKDYKIEFLTKEVDDHSYHNSSALFKFVLFPLKSGPVAVDFDFIVKTATDKAVAKAYVEDHDDSVGIDLKTTHIPIKPLLLHVKPLAQKVDLVGDFTLQSRIDKTKIDQYGSVNLHYILRGTGYSNVEKILPKLTDVTTFFDVETLANKLTEKGYLLEKEFIYAFSAKKSFVIPKVALKAFSPTRNEYYTLTAPSYTVDVKTIDPSTLLDKEESPNEQPLIAYKTLKEWFIYLVIFAFGYLSATLANSKIEFGKKKKAFEKFDKSKTPKELMLLLIRDYGHDPVISDYIDKLETMMREKSTKEFEKLKKEVIKRLEGL